jgi:hypothetical protein
MRPNVRRTALKGHDIPAQGGALGGLGRSGVVWGGLGWSGDVSAMPDVRWHRRLWPDLPSAKLAVWMMPGIPGHPSPVTQGFALGWYVSPLSGLRGGTTETVENASEPAKDSPERARHTSRFRFRFRSRVGFRSRFGFRFRFRSKVRVQEQVRVQEHSLASCPSSFSRAGGN